MNTDPRPTRPVSADELASRQAQARLSAEEKKNNKARFIALGGVGLAAVLGGGAAAYAATHNSGKPEEEEEEIVIGEPAQPAPAPQPTPQPAPAPAHHAAPAQPDQQEEPEKPEPEKPEPEKPEPEKPEPEKPEPEKPEPEKPEPEKPEPPTPPTPPTPVDDNHVEAIAFVDDAGTVWVRIDDDKYVNEQGELWTEELAEQHVVVAFMPNESDTYVLVDPQTASYAHYPDGDKIVQLTPPATPEDSPINHEDDIIVPDDPTDDVLADNTKGEEHPHTDDTDDDIVITDDDHGLPQCEPDIEVEIITEDITLENCHLDADIDEEATPMPDDPEPADLGNEDLTADL